MQKNLRNARLRGIFLDVGDATATATAEATATAKPEYNDAPADTTVVQNSRERHLVRHIMCSSLHRRSMRLTRMWISAPRGFGRRGYKIINEYASKEYKDGKTYLEYAKEYGLELLRDFLATREWAPEAGKTYTEERKGKVDTRWSSQIRFDGGEELRRSVA